jgi:stage II sporulation protein AB (anti-sigma F factor)
MTQVKLATETEPLALRLVRKQVAAAAAAVGASMLDTRRVEVAVGEALANAYLHGYEGSRGPVEIDLTYDGQRLVVAIHDEGKGLPFEPAFPAPPDPRTGNGYGLHMLKELMDEAAIQHPGVKGRGTSVRMAIRLH